ncbi:MAG: hypothetical protein AAF479_11460 [Pseudomonadota bacterium]
MRRFRTATHYYGFAEYLWPINYLNSIKISDIDGDFEKIIDLGFDTIILLVSWSELEPKVGVREARAYDNLHQIVKKAEESGLDVSFRLPYLWSLEASETRERLVYALIDYENYREKLISFVADFDREFIQTYGNAVSKFGSWEDFYVIRDCFFSSEGIASDETCAAFFRDANVDPDRIELNGENYDLLLDWIDRRIQQLCIEIGDYGFEVRADWDPYLSDGELKWHNHGAYHENRSGGELATYWATYFTQANDGEMIGADSAVRSFIWLLDLIAQETSQVPFVDQFNFVDTTHGTEKHAKLNEDEYGEFFEKATDVIVERTMGYALWTIKDYNHNLIYNSALSAGTKGWDWHKATPRPDGGAVIKSGGHLSKTVPKEAFRVAESPSLSLVVKTYSGDAAVEIGSLGTFDLPGAGRHEIPIDAPACEDLSFEIRTTMANEDAIVEWVGLFGHRQIGGVIDQHGDPSDHYSQIRRFNRLLKDRLNTSRPGSTIDEMT